MQSPKEIRKTVSTTYARAVDSPVAAKPCCCGSAAPKGAAATLASYTREALAALPADAVNNSFGCGNPVALGAVHEGDTVLDLGSGAGIDLLLAAKLAGPTGRAIGVDMTPAMIEHARRNAAAARLANVEVREGIIENLPVDDASVDLVISNCVINLSPEKPRVFAEIARVLKPGGRFSISDIVAEEMPAWVRELGPLYSACIAGAVSETEYLIELRSAGLTDLGIKDRLVYDQDQLLGLLQPELLGDCESEGESPSTSQDQGCCCSGAAPSVSVSMSGDRLKAAAAVLAGKVASIRVVGRKPREAR